LWKIKLREEMIDYRLRLILGAIGCLEMVSVEGVTIPTDPATDTNVQILTDMPIRLTGPKQTRQDDRMALGAVSKNSGGESREEPGKPLVEPRSMIGHATVVNLGNHHDLP
jgi:hypothetical protein